MRNHGYSLLELTFVLMVSAIALAMAVAPIARARDILAVRAARSEIAGLLAMARSTAIRTGGAELVVDVAEGSAWLEEGAGQRVGAMHHIGARHGVALAANRTLLRFRYDALGIGRMTNAVVRVRRGSVTGAVTVSAYGRVRQS
jgi:prepilin-type N-terminal cleavage/methylation domain-containing protein